MENKDNLAANLVRCLDESEGLEGEADKAAFSDVVLTTFGRDERGASFEITIKFDPSIFDNTKKITIKVPVGVTTRSVTEKPGSLFAPLNDPDKQKEGQ